MATCKDCLHYEACKRFNEIRTNVINKSERGAENLCENYADKSRFVELPCKVGDTVYRISRRYGVWEILPREVVNLTYYIDYLGRAKWWIFTTVEDKLGETVFLTREEAEAALAERRAHDPN